MCVVCGCAEPAHDHEHSHATAPGHERDREHVHDHDHSHGPDDLHYGAGAARVSVPGMSQARTIRLEADILGENNRIAAQNRRHFEAHAVTALNLLSSPGSGKTTLLCATIDALHRRAEGLSVSVIEGDQQTSFDAERIRATGAPAIQVNTGKGCHLDAPMVAEAFARLHSHDHHHGHPHDSGSLLFIENVGNLVCPALWDLGEAAKVVVLSVTEGEDKPLKYPDMFAAADLMVLNKIDLLPHLRFDVERCIAGARRVNPRLEVIQLSATTGEGMERWLDWLAACCGTSHDAMREGSADLRARVAQLETALAQARAQLERTGT
ncbi:hydrogenase nickel incorporation protein HypB [Variovorax ureilyticus]|uniref:Hydrogenase maturation factor HypB n=1 Tax=Variovorax ureilyticus TaxID=1836198 RepID=A0ABU8VPQ1_9BURK